MHVEDAHGAQPVHYAAAAGSMEKLTALTNAGADLDAVTHNGFTALCWAAQVGARVAPQALFSRSRPSLSLHRVAYRAAGEAFCGTGLGSASAGFGWLYRPVNRALIACFLRLVRWAAVALMKATNAAAPCIISRTRQQSHASHSHACWGCAGGAPERGEGAGGAHDGSHHGVARRRRLARARRGGGGAGHGRGAHSGERPPTPRCHSMGTLDASRVVSSLSLAHAGAARAAQGGLRRGAEGHGVHGATRRGCTGAPLSMPLCSVRHFINTPAQDRWCPLLTPRGPPPLARRSFRRSRWRR